MTGPRSTPKDVKDPEKRQLDEALEEGLEETFPGVGPGQCHPAAALERRPSRQAQGLGGPPFGDREPNSSCINNSLSQHRRVGGRK